MFGKVLLTFAKVAVGLATAYALYRVCASDSYVPEVVGCGEVPKEEEEEEEVEEEVHEHAVELADGCEEVPSEDSGGAMPDNEQVLGADRVVQGQGSQDMVEEVPEEDSGGAMPGGEQVLGADRVVQGQGSHDMVEEVPEEDNGEVVLNGEQVGSSDQAVQEHVGEEVPVEDSGVNRVGQGEVVDEVEGEAGDEENGGGEDVAQGVVAPPVLHNDEHNAYGIDFDYQIPCDEIVSFLPDWSPQFVFGGPMLGRGAFGSVQLCQDGNGAMCAVKTVEFRDEFDAESMRPTLKKEVELQARCAGPHVVGAYGHWGTEYEMNLVFEFARFGSAESYVFQRSDVEGRAVPDRQAAHVVRDVARALATCHQRGVAHCDVKLANVLVCEDGVLKLSDFGLAVQVDDEDGMTDVRSFEPQFAAPELKGEGRYGTKVDMWAIGIMLYELLLGTRRWHLAICAAGRDHIPGAEGMADDAKDLLTKLLSEDAEDRPSAEEVVTHPWVRRNVD